MQGVDGGSRRQEAALLHEGRGQGCQAEGSDVALKVAGASRDFTAAEHPCLRLQQGPG